MGPKAYNTRQTIVRRPVETGESVACEGLFREVRRAKFRQCKGNIR